MLNMSNKLLEDGQYIYTKYKYGYLFDIYIVKDNKYMKILLKERKYDNTTVEEFCGEYFNTWYELDENIANKLVPLNEEEKIKLL